MGDILWQLSSEDKKKTNIWDFMEFAGAREGKTFEDYPALYHWSVEEPEAFWGACWDYFGVVASKKYDAILEDADKMPGAKWFRGAKLNYAENLLKWHDTDGVAIIFRNEDGQRREISRRDLYKQVTGLASALRKRGVGQGDLVAGYMPNIPEAVIAMLAAVSVGAAWCSCATDIGADAATDRLAQLHPKVLFTADGYPYKGKVFDVVDKVAAVQQQVQAQWVVVTHYYGDLSRIDKIENNIRWDDFTEKQAPQDFAFTQVDADAPLFVMFSSGTTGKPKCMVHTHGGLILNQMKEIILQNDIRPHEPVMYITTCSWMMWNWQLGSLAVGAVLTLYDGNVSYPDLGQVWRVLEQERVALFGLSASYIHLLMKEGYSPRAEHDLSALRCISQTGSALQEAGFRYVYEHIKENVHFSSISGGTDINGSFISGNPLMPVRAGELQMPALGMPVACFNEDGQSVWDEQGELVCTKPIPTMPLCFVDDPDGQKYHDAYFDIYPGIWRHGDYVMFHKDTLGVSFYGRSDSILKPSGVRIGTSEIYNIVNKIEQVVDSLAIGQHFHGDQRIILFVKLRDGVQLDQDLVNEIRQRLKKNASPRHVPAHIIQCPDYSRTINGKKVESSVTNILNNRKVSNKAALENPEILEFYEQQAIKLRDV